MSKTISAPFTLGSKSFDPENLFQDEEKLKAANAFLEKNDLRSAIVALFSLPENDTYVYHAVASVTLTQVQHAIIQGDQHGLHDWYKDEDGKPVSRGPRDFLWICAVPVLPDFFFDPKLLAILSSFSLLPLSQSSAILRKRTSRPTYPSSIPANPRVTHSSHSPPMRSAPPSAPVSPGI
jgi:hypothetical protein